VYSVFAPTDVLDCVVVGSLTVTAKPYLRIKEIGKEIGFRANFENVIARNNTHLPCTLSRVPNVLAVPRAEPQIRRV
jgi:hypothetical protein